MLKIIVLAFTIGLGTCFVQADHAALTGTITDATQAAVPGAHVKVVYPIPDSLAIRSPPLWCVTTG
jgi:hypothetical protein